MKENRQATSGEVAKSLIKNNCAGCAWWPTVKELAEYSRPTKRNHY